MHRVIHASGDNELNVLVTPASIVDAYLRDWQSYDSGVLPDIWVRNSASLPPTVSYTGSPIISTNSDTGAKTYSYTGVTDGRMNVHTYNGSGGTVENNNYTGAYQVNYNVSTAYTVNNTLYYKKSDGTYAQYPNTVYYGYKKSTLTVSGIDTGSGSATLVFTPMGETWNSGKVSIAPYTPETVARKVLQPASLTPEKVSTQKWSYFTRIDSTAEEETKTLLAHGTTSVQNFAFEIDEDDLY